MSNKQPYFLCVVIMLSVASIFQPKLLMLPAFVLLAFAAWGKP